jgi:hypothetical protein
MYTSENVNLWKFMNPYALSKYPMGGPQQAVRGNPNNQIAQMDG